MLLIIPAYNEQDSIVSTIADIKANAPHVDFVIINDGSTDNTASVCADIVEADKTGSLINLPVNLDAPASDMRFTNFDASSFS